MADQIDPETGLPVSQQEPIPIVVAQQQTIEPETGLPVGPQPTARTIAEFQHADAGSNLSSNPIANSATELRVRLSPLHPADIFTDEINQGPLGFMAKSGIGGVLFPYTPTINFSQAVNYADLSMVHSNSDYAAYTRTPSVSIGITGKFTVQNRDEAQYALACIHFLRSVSKSHFGENDPQHGLPPPILLLNGYGSYMFNNLRCILKNHSWTFDDNVDSVVVVAGDGGIARIPTLFNITVELMVVQTPSRMREVFSFNAFASGQLMNGSGLDNTGWI